MKWEVRFTVDVEDDYFNGAINRALKYLSDRPASYISNVNKVG
jgi:hypothetical protein